MAQQYATASIEASAKLKLEAELLKEKGRNDRAQASLELRQDLGEKRLRQSARAQEAVQLRFDQSMDLRERNFALGRATKIISQAKEDRRQLNTEIDDLNFRVTGLREGKIFIDRAGNKLTKESRMQEIQDIQRDISKMTGQRDELTDEIAGYEIKFKDIGVKARAKEEPASATETEPSNAKVPTADRIAKVQEYVKTYPDQAATIKANWEKEYPNVKFEDAIQGKVTISSNRTPEQIAKDSLGPGEELVSVKPMTVGRSKKGYKVTFKKQVSNRGGSSEYTDTKIITE
jgi:predicted  nucleic acid-binding Zn-ribbon protein